VDFPQIVIWGAQAENTANFCRKGRQLAVAGRLATRVYQNNDGRDVYVTEVVADEVEFLAKPRPAGNDGVSS
jgi:single-strand DNA-binding protein